MNEEEFSSWYNELGLLTYGEIDDEYILDSFRTILQWKKDREFISDKIPNNLFTVNEYWLLLSILGKCIEYGSSPRGGWLTNFGNEVLDYLTKFHNEILDEQIND